MATPLATGFNVLMAQHGTQLRLDGASGVSFVGLIEQPGQLFDTFEVDDRPRPTSRIHIRSNASSVSRVVYGSLLVEVASKRRHKVTQIERRDMVTVFTCNISES